MDNNDRQAIETLFGNIAEAEKTTGPIDRQAEALIREKVAAQPAAPYLMAQTIVIQEQALNAAQDRIDQLEQQASRPPSGGLFSSLFGGGGASAQRPTQPRQAYQRQAATGQAGPMGGAYPETPANEAARGPWGQQRNGGGSFLAGAAQTAMGVAGGVLLGNAIAGMFGGSEANAAEPVAAEPEQDFGMEDSMGDME